MVAQKRTTKKGLKTFTKESVRAAIVACGGNHREAMARLKCCKTTFYARLREAPELTQVIIDARAQFIRDVKPLLSEVILEKLKERKFSDIFLIYLCKSVLELSDNNIKPTGEGAIPIKIEFRK